VADTSVTSTPTHPSSKCVTVDSVEFGRLFLFPRILGAALSALQPSRLIIALFMVVLLIAVGRIWDRMIEPNVHPDGLALGTYSVAEDGPRHQSLLRTAIATFSPALLPTDDNNQIETRQALRWVNEGYRDQRNAAASDRDRERIDEAYTELLRQMELTRPKGDFEATVTHVSRSFSQTVRGVLSLDKDRTLGGLYSLLIETPVALWKYHPWFLSIFGALTLVVMALGGGALARMAACQASSGERLSMREAVDFATQRWGRLIWSLVLPLAIAAIIALLIVLLGLLMAAPVLDVVGGIVYGLALVLGFFITFLLVGYVLGFPMLIPAVACENCDGADAMQRAYAYTVTKPLQLLGYWLAGLIGAGLGYLLVGLFALLMLSITADLYRTVSDNPALNVAGAPGLFDLSRTGFDGASAPVGGAWHHRWAGGAIAFWQALVLCIVAAYVISYFYSASTIGYLLMRRAVDGQDPEEIWRPGLVPGTLAPIPEPRSAAEPGAPESPANDG
jgi:hypothetical protein